MNGVIRNGLVCLCAAAFFGVLSIGGDYATRRADLPSDFLLMFMGLMFLFMVVTQYLTSIRAGRPGAAAIPPRPNNQVRARRRIIALSKPNSATCHHRYSSLRKATRLS